uniref:SUN domain-containing protein n=1 Tax=Sphenodon punctatus TaxID=8508 RepID=A0A8D0LAJ3_SPHPU
MECLTGNEAPPTPPGAQIHPPFHSPGRSVRRKSSSVKRLSPAPGLGPPPATHTSYYSESVISEFCVSWTGEPLSVRRRRGTGGTESSKINGLTESKTYDTYASSSGYSSEDDYAGHSCMDQTGSGSGFRTVLSRAGSFLWLVLTSPGRLFGLLYWWIGTAWYRLTTAASLLDVFVLTRSVWGGWELGEVGMGAWYFYPFGLHSSMLSWGAVKVSPPVARRGETHGAAEQQIVSRLQALERRFEALEAEASHLALQRTAAGGGLAHGDTLALLEGLVSRREAALRDDFHKDRAVHIQRELDAVRIQLQEDFSGRLRQIVQASQVSRPCPGKQQSVGVRDVCTCDVSKGCICAACPSCASTLSLGLGAYWSGVCEICLVVSLQQVHLIVNRALKYFSEDRVGMVDYALESAGASVISTRCSETYETKTALLSLFGIPLWYHSQSPRVILQPDVNPGNCWAFRGSQGFAVIRLSSNIHPTAVTLEHIPRSLSPMGTIPSAPKGFAVYSLAEEGQQEGTLLGQFVYDQDKDPIQTFHFQVTATYKVVELRILSNWGHPEYTCIYRFRVHGEPVH